MIGSMPQASRLSCILQTLSFCSMRNWSAVAGGLGPGEEPFIAAELNKTRVFFIFLSSLSWRPGTEDRCFSRHRDNSSKDVERHLCWTAFLAHGTQDTLWNLYRCIPDRESLLFYLPFGTPVEARKNYELRSKKVPLLFLFAFFYF